MAGLIMADRMAATRMAAIGAGDDGDPGDHIRTHRTGDETTVLIV
jgi:hypothetical protein